MSYGHTPVRTSLSPGWASLGHLESDSLGAEPETGRPARVDPRPVSPAQTTPLAPDSPIQRPTGWPPGASDTAHPNRTPLSFTPAPPPALRAPRVSPPHPVSPARSTRSLTSASPPSPSASTPSTSPANSASSSVPPPGASASHQVDHSSSSLTGPAFQTLLPSSDQGDLKMQIYLNVLPGATPCNSPVLHPPPTSPSAHPFHGPSFMLSSCHSRSAHFPSPPDLGMYHSAYLDHTSRSLRLTCHLHPSGLVCAGSLAKPALLQCKPCVFPWP